MTPKEINQKLASNINDLCRMLFPNGVVKGSNFEVGSVNGEKGQSLKIPLNGEHLGGFNDFESGEKGDLIDLWCNSKGLDFQEGLKEIKRYLGISDISVSIGKLTTSSRKPEELTSLPKYDCVSENPKWSKYLEKRGITDETAKEYKIGVYNDKMFFPHFFDGKPIMWHTRSYKTKNGEYEKNQDGSLKKDFATNKNPLYCLWGWNGVKKEDREIVITEGRIDALSFIEQGIKALSLPCGGGKGAKQSWIDFDYHNLIDHFDKIYLSIDDDKAGNEALNEIISRLGEHRCWIVKLPEKDANQCHVKGLDLKKYLAEAKQIIPDGLHKAGEFYEDIVDYFHPADLMSNAIYLPWEKTSGYMAREGEVTLIAGENGSGKTQLVGHIMLGGFDQGKKFGIASMEMSPKMLLGRLTKQATTNYSPSKEYIKVVSDYFNEWLWVYRKKGIANKEQILKSFEYLRKRYGIKYFIIDSLAKCGINEDDYNGQKKFIDQLEAFVDDNQCHIFLVHHIRKSDQKNIDKPPGKNDVKGTGAIVDMIDNLLILWRNRPKEDFLANIKTDFESEKERKKYNDKVEKVTKKGDAVLDIAKQRNGDFEGKVPLWFDKNSYQFLNSQDTRPHRFIKYSALK